MREYKGPDGHRKLWYDPVEIDQIMVEELARAEMLPDPDRDDVTVELERLIDKHLRFPFDQHADLDADVLGVTQFLIGRRPKIQVNRDLTGAFDADDATDGVKGRWRATVAHEIGHALLHRILYELDDLQRGLFDGAPPGLDMAEPRLMRCLKRDASYSGGRDWREVQANKAIGALLMPRPVMLKVVEQERDRLHLAASLDPGSIELSELVAAVARRFTVSRQAAHIRVEGIGCIAPRGQARLRA